MATPSSSQGTQDAHQPEEVAVDRGALQHLFCTKQQSAALLAVQQGVQGKAVGWWRAAAALHRQPRSPPIRCLPSPCAELDLLRGLFVRFLYQGRYHVRAVEGVEYNTAGSAATLLVQVR